MECSRETPIIVQMPAMYNRLNILDLGDRETPKELLVRPFAEKANVITHESLFTPAYSLK